MSALQFGTSGLRGLVSDMTPEICARYARAFIRYIEATSERSKRALLFGRDLRESSAAISEACAAGAQSAGYEAIDCGEVPTPALALAADRLGLPAIMITGSHIPADRNGLKFYTAAGEITKADEAGILAHLEASLVAPVLQKLPTLHKTALSDYAARYTSLRPRASLEGMKIGVYQHSTVARDLLVQLLQDLGANAVPLGRTSSFIPLDTEAVSKDVLEQFRKWSNEQGLDAVVSSDGDADRPLMADEKGDLIRGDTIGVLTAAFLGADTVVTPVTSTSAIELSGLFKTTIRTRVGSPYVIEAIETNRSGITIGFEANGGVLLGSVIREQGFDLSALPTRDAFLPIISVLASARAKGATLSGLVASLPARFTASDRIENVARDRSSSFIEAVRDLDRAEILLADVGSVVRVDTLDGVKIFFDAGDTLHFRASGNAPELRCYAEASELTGAATLLQFGLAVATRQLAKS